MLLLQIPLTSFLPSCFLTTTKASMDFCFSELNNFFHLKNINLWLFLWIVHAKIKANPGTGFDSIFFLAPSSLTFSFHQESGREKPLRESRH